MHVPLLDLKNQYAAIRDEVLPELHKVLESQQLILGPRVLELERQVASYCQASYALGVSSGTDAMLLALMTAGVQPGDEVITTPFTFFATAGCISRLSAVPVFVDIDPGTFNIDPAAIEAKVTPRTRAIIPVHLYGLCADMDPILDLARRHDLFVIEDAAQAIGAEYRSRRAGSLGDFGCFSFYPTKNLGAFGDGGLLTTNDPDCAELARTLRTHGETQKYLHRYVGGNFRLDALQAVALLVKLRHLDDWTAARRRNAQTYNRLFSESGLSPAHVVTPDPGTDRHVFNQYVIRAKSRDKLREFLKLHDVGTEVYYPVPLHLQECFADLGYSRGSLPQSEKAADEVLALPVYPELSPQQQEYVVQTVGRFYRESGARK